YAQTLATLERERTAPLAFAVAANGGILRRRIARILGQRPARHRDVSGSGLIAAVILTGLAAAALWAQAGPRFDAATVKPNHSGTGVDHIRIGGGSVTIQNVSLKRLIGMAHGVQEGRSYLFSGPDWLDSENFDVLAKYPADTPETQVLQMLQRELEERFSLRLHRETKEFSAYALVLTKDGPKFHATVRPGGAYRFSLQNGHAAGSAITMGMLGDRLSRPDFGLDRPVVDQTGLTGAYDITLDWKPGEPGTPSASLFTAIQQQLGLRLEARKIPLEVLVVDHAEKIPKGN
ncbi:MAG TPA: TIGR03435 family protein, partial [Bryobacteraceae bacterium]|nr:TIGR03435 family protein [Bryobacteraceae bacterium]